MTDKVNCRPILAIVLFAVGILTMTALLSIMITPTAQAQEPPATTVTATVTITGSGTLDRDAMTNMTDVYNVSSHSLGWKFPINGTLEIDLVSVDPNIQTLMCDFTLIWTDEEDNKYTLPKSIPAIVGHTPENESMTKVMRGTDDNGDDVRIVVWRCEEDGEADGTITWILELVNPIPVKLEGPLQK